MYEVLKIIDVIAFVGLHAYNFHYAKDCRMHAFFNRHCFNIMMVVKM